MPSDNRKPLHETIRILSGNDRIGDLIIQLRWEIDAPWEAADDETKAETRPTHVIDFDIIEVVAIDYKTKAELYFAADASHTTDITAASPQVHGFIKWDGCMQWWHEDQPVHVDSHGELDRWQRALVMARRRALEVLKDEDHEYDEKRQGASLRGQALAWFQAGFNFGESGDVGAYGDDYATAPDREFSKLWDGGLVVRKDARGGYR